MSYTQLKSPNLAAVGEIGMCLQYASRFVFQNPAPGTTAWDAWEVTEHRHTDQNFPPGVSFPVWFSGAGGAGHVAVYTPNGIYSSPYNTKFGHAVLPSIAKVESTYKVKYVGRSDDILQLKVIGDDMANTLATFDEVNDLCVGMMGVEAKTNPNFMNNVGIPISDAIRNIFHYKEAVDFRNRASTPPNSDAVVLKPGKYQVN